MNLTYTAEFILSIPVTEPERLFPASFDGIKNEFLSLIKEWHPDHNNSPQASEVVQHLLDLKVSANKKLTGGLWQVPGQVEILTMKGKKFNFSFRSKHDIEIGTMYVGNKHVLFVIQKQHKTLYENGLKHMRDFVFGSTEMRKEMEKYLPKIKWTEEGLDYYYVLLTKSSDVVLLRDLVKHYNGKIPPKHVGWIISSVLNIGCYLSWAQTAHQAINIDTVFVSPKQHSGLLLGGWWYAMKEGESLRGRSLPAQSAALMSTAQLRARTAAIQLDQDLIRALGRELLGDASGTMLRASNDLPQEIINWAKGTSTKGALDSYKQWKAVLVKSFGPPKFVKMQITPDQIYTGET